MIRAARPGPSWRLFSKGVNTVRSLGLDVGSVTVGVAVSDPLGMFAQPVRTLQAVDLTSGRFTVSWDGADNAGQTVLPGLYLFKIKVKSDERNQEVVGTISVAY